MSSARDYVILQLPSGAGSKAAVALGGTAVLSTAQHSLDGAEHTDATDDATLLPTTAHSGLLRALDGRTYVYLAGDNEWRVAELRGPTMTPVALSADTDNWAPVDAGDATITLGKVSVIRADLATHALTGLVAPAAGERDYVLLVALTAGTLKHNVTSTAANRFLCPNDADIALNPDTSVLLWYDATSASWRIVGGTGSGTAAAGPAGGGIAIAYTFATATADADPGPGLLRLNNATENAATVIRADLLDANGVDVTVILDSLDDSDSTVKGVVRLFKTDDPTKWITATLSAVASPSGYRNITIVVLDSSSASPFAAADGLTLAFTRTGDKGTTGTTGTTGSTGQPGGPVSIPYTFDTTTADADPGNGKLRLNNATENAASVIRADLLDNLGTDWTAVLDTLDASTGNIKGHIRLVNPTDASKWLVFTLASRAAPAGYRNLSVSAVSGSSATPFANGDPVQFVFERAGDKGSDTYDQLYAAHQLR